MEMSKLLSAVDSLRLLNDLLQFEILSCRLDNALWVAGLMPVGTIKAVNIEKYQAFPLQL